MKKAIIVIPARYKSSRFPGKPLIIIKGIAMIEHVWNKCLEVKKYADAIVATDDLRIVNYCKLKNIKYMLTSKNCITGTDRVAEVAKKTSYELYINIQGDEPFIDTNDLINFMKIAFKNKNKVMNGMTKIRNKKELNSYNIPKVVVSENNKLLYMSRNNIPINKLSLSKDLMKQVCVYSFPKKILIKVYNNKKTRLEKIEDIEILRLLEKEFPVYMYQFPKGSIAIDTPEDLRKI